MPTYEYRCTKCGEQLEVVQGFHDDPLTKCPVCKGKLRKLFSPVGVVFKGSGFYKTDSRSGKSSSSSAAGSTGTSTDTKTDAKSDTNSDGKSDSSTTATETKSGGSSTSSTSSSTGTGGSDSTGGGSKVA